MIEWIKKQCSDLTGKGRGCGEQTRIHEMRNGSLIAFHSFFHMPTPSLHGRSIGERVRRLFQLLALQLTLEKPCIVPSLCWGQDFFIDGPRVRIGLGAAEVSLAAGYKHTLSSNATWDVSWRMTKGFWTPLPCSLIRACLRNQRHFFAEIFSYFHQVNMWEVDKPLHGLRSVPS